ncbi:DEAD/DEAH box helicase family protein [Salinibacter ruber]|uniref:DEAD/DEAH box helicase family protein n=1 Tax=Salinibacter ruber TaxID=146919 RepID=UPI000E5825EC|nr:DEAD/DEAH box helicase family protein [Salinibacter ruber]
MSLRDAFPARTIDTSSHDIVGDFFVPMLQNATRYDRGVGYFSSGWLRANAQGMVDFAANGGRARWITSPKLSESDWQHLQKGDRARRDRKLRDVLSRRIDDLERSLENDTLSTLAWLVADGILDFRLAVPREKLDQGDFHVKFGIFRDDDDNRVGFNGSYNDSIQGLRNYESLNVFPSWDDASVYVDNVEDRFQRLWEDEDPSVRTYVLPEAARHQIIELRSDERPYRPPESVEYPTMVPTAQVGEDGMELWAPQKDAIEAWVENDCVGLLNMATGSGKTVAALVVAESRPDLQLLVIAVPTTNLVEQWGEELQSVTDFSDPVLIFGSSAEWQDRVFRKLRAGHRRGWPKPLVLIGTMASMSGDRFQSVLADAGIPERAMLIVDEVHNVGAPTYRRILDPSYSLRLGLSATPKRQYDKEGSDAIVDFFEEEVYHYSMEEALADEQLSPYTYHVYPAPLTTDEYEEYLSLTQRILAARNDAGEDATLFTNNRLDGDSQDVEMLLFRRANILKKATAKVDLVREMLDDHPLERGLIYCADREQLQSVHEILRDLGVVHLRYTGETPKEKRQSALDALAAGDVPAILAIKCLDEGVDVPAADTAILLASSRNERQFIQRRGRILRQAPGKDTATLVDAIALPPPEVGRDGKWMLEGELARAQTMAELADNQHGALLQLQDHAERYGVYLSELLADDTDQSSTPHAERDIQETGE